MTTTPSSSSTTYSPEVEYFTNGRGFHNQRDNLSERELKNTYAIPKRKFGPYTEEQLDEMRVPMHLRDQCVHHVLKLNQCRERYNFFPLGKCDEQLHKFQRCQFKQYLKMVKTSQELWKKELKLKMIYERLEQAKREAAEDVSAEQVAVGADEE